VSEKCQPSPEAVKEALGKMGLKQGGTDEQRRDRLWSTRGKSLDQVDRKHFAKGAAPAGKDSGEAAKREESAKAVARVEGLAERLLEHLGNVLDATKVGGCLRKFNANDP
jgi:splicing factor 3A subunit 3